MKLIFTFLFSILNLNLFAADGYLAISNKSIVIGPGGSGGGSQTPWTSDINGGGFQLTNSGNITSTGTVSSTGLSVPGTGNNFVNALNVSSNLIVTNIGVNKVVGTDASGYLTNIVLLPLISPNGFVVPPHPGQRVLLYDDIYNKLVGTQPENLGAGNSGGFASGITDLDTNHLGLILLNCITNAGSYAETSARPDAVVMSAADWYIEWSFRFTNTDSTMSLSNGWFKVGWVEGRIDIASQSSGCWAQLQNGSPNWSLVTANNSTRTTNTTSTVGWTNLWQTIGVFSPWPNTNAILYVNGTSVATNTANVPSGIDNPTTARIGAGASASGLGTSSLGIYVDYVWMALSPHSWP